MVELVMKNSGLTVTIVMQANSANYGESIGNVSSLKKLTRQGGNQYTYISRQALRYNIVEQFGETFATLGAEGSGDKKVIQFSKDATIDKFPEIDFFGYMKTQKNANALTRSAKVRLSNAISQEPYFGDIDFLTNKGLADRMKNNGVDVNNSIAQSEIHEAYYAYTMTIDLDQIGVDDNYNINLSNAEKSRRVKKLLDVVQYLYRDIRGRREDLKPLFIIGGVYDLKNPLFENAVRIKKNKVVVESINSVLENKEIRDNTFVGMVPGIFENDNEVREKLDATNINSVIESLQKKVSDYYEGN